MTRRGLSLKCSLMELMLFVAVSVNLMPAQTGKLFDKYYDAAEQTLQDMSLEEKIAQVLLVRYPDDDGVEVLRERQFGGYIFFAQDFAGKSEAEVQEMMADLRKVAKVPILTAVDEEGGTVVRVSSNSKLAEKKFLSPQALYNNGGFAEIRADTEYKSEVLQNLGINLNLAPVVDVSTDATDYMYQRSIGQNTKITSEYAQTVIAASKKGAVSYTLKHFPGYGNNLDTHKGASNDTRSYLEILQNDIPPFRAGIDAGAEAVLVSHNVVESIDAENPASLSPRVHRLLTETLGFTGVVITDDISMGALENMGNTSVRALLTGNDLIITSDYVKSMAEMRVALENGSLSEENLNRHVRQVLAWKYYKGMM